MAHFVFISHGSTGDIIPVIRVAEAVVRDGHGATLLTSEYWRSIAESKGISVVQIPPEGERRRQVQLMEQFSSIRNNRVLLEAMFRVVDSWQPDIIPLLRNELSRADALVCSYLFPIYGHYAKESGIPSISLHFCTNTYLSSGHPPAALPRLPKILPTRVRNFWNERFTQLADRYVVKKLNRLISHSEQRLETWLRCPTDNQIVLTPDFMHQGSPEQLPSHTIFSGFVEGGIVAEEETSDPLPISDQPLITFGSVAHPELNRRFEELYQQWPSDQPLYIQVGWSEPPPPPGHSKIRLIPSSPHRPLFAKASVIIHHGGAGTTTSAFLAGKPQIVVPHFADQDFWASTVAALSCGSKLHYRRWPRKLFQTVSATQENVQFRENAQRIAKQPGIGDGAKQAAAALERWVSS
ncbi:MAG: glycosyltransferase [Verrucomicrobiota bacterium]